MSARDPPYAPTGSPPPMTLPKQREIGSDADALERAAAGHAEARDHLVEHEERPGAIAERAQPREESRSRWDAAHVARVRLDDHRRDARVDRALAGRQVVVFDDDRLPGRRRAHAGGIGKPERRDARAGPREQSVAVTVVATRELHDARAAGRGARDAERAHRGLGARRDEPEHLDRRVSGDDGLGELDLERRRGAVRGPERRLIGDRAHDVRMRVAEDERAPRADEVDVFASVRVPHPRSGSADDERGLAAHRAIRADRARHAAGHHGLGPAQEGLVRSGRHDHAAASSAK